MRLSGFAIQMLVLLGIAGFNSVLIAAFRPTILLIIILLSRRTAEAKGGQPTPLCD